MLLKHLESSSSRIKRNTNKSINEICLCAVWQSAVQPEEYHQRQLPGSQFSFSETLLPCHISCYPFMSTSLTRMGIACPVCRALTIEQSLSCGLHATMQMHCSANERYCDPHYSTPGNRHMVDLSC